MSNKLMAGIVGYEGFEQVVTGEPGTPRHPGPTDYLPPKPAPHRASPPENYVDTSEWRYELRSEYPQGAMCRHLMADVRLVDLPQQVREQLHQRGCQAWVDDPGGDVLSFEAIIVGTSEIGNLVRDRYGPPPLVSLDDLVAKVIGDGTTPAQRRQKHREITATFERQAQEKLAKEQAEAKAKEAARLAAELAKDEERRRLSPAYCLRKMEELASKLLGKQA